MRYAKKLPHPKQLEEPENTRAALLIRCTKADAEAIRKVAKRERRTISGFIMHVVMNYIGNRESVLKKVQEKIDATKQERQAKGHAA